MVVEFPSFEFDELRTIVKELIKKNNYQKSDIVEKINDLHYQWVYNEKDFKSSSQCFTVRDINATIKAISEGQDPSDAVNCFYWSRYRRNEFNHLMEILRTKYSPLYKNLNSIPELPNDFPKCYSNFSWRKAFYFANIAKKNCPHLLIVGKEGSGVTQVSIILFRLISINFTSIIQNILVLLLFQKFSSIFEVSCVAIILYFYYN